VLGGQLGGLGRRSITVKGGRSWMLHQGERPASSVGNVDRFCRRVRRLLEKLLPARVEKSYEFLGLRGLKKLKS
jgi:hypothetical protein